MPIIKKVKKLSKWVSLVEAKFYNYANDKPDVYYGLNLHDYVSVIAQNNKKEIILIKQFRPLINKYTIELPGGLKDKNISHYDAAKKELYEETGFKIKTKMKFLCKNYIDIGRLNNQMYGYYAEINDFKEKKWLQEKGLTLIRIKPNKLLDLLLDGRIISAIHSNIIFCAFQKNAIRF